jgi:hypothetical protein
MMVITEIHAGVCGFQTTVKGRSDDMQNVTLEIESTCEKITALAADIKAVDAYAEIGAGFEGVVLTAARARLRGCCAGCAVPSGIFKTVQVAGAVALPAPISITIRKED